MARHVAHGCADDVRLAACNRHVGVRVTSRAPWGSCGRLNETSDAFAGGKWPEFGCFVRAEVSSVSNVCAKELAVVSSVSDEAAAGPASKKSHAIRLGEVSIKSENVAIPTI